MLFFLECVNIFLYLKKITQKSQTMEESPGYAVSFIEVEEDEDENRF